MERLLIYIMRKNNGWLLGLIKYLNTLVISAEDLSPTKGLLPLLDRLRGSLPLCLLAICITKHRLGIYHMWGNLLWEFKTMNIKTFPDFLYLVLRWKLLLSPGVCCEMFHLPHLIKYRSINTVYIQTVCA